jgi:protein TonB
MVPDTPPPPPPPKEERRPEPPKESPKEIKLEQPKQEPPPQPQQAEQLKMEGAGSDTGLAGVAAGAVQQEYSGQKIGGTGAGGSHRFAWFESAIERSIQQALQRNSRLRGVDYRVVVQVWLSPEGAISRTDLNGSTGNRETDEQIRLALAEMQPLRDKVPDGLPQPIKLRVTSRL